MGTGGKTIFDIPKLLVVQKAKLLETKAEYSIHTEQGDKVAAVRQIGQGVVKRAIRLTSRFDEYFTHKLEVVDAEGTRLFVVTKPKSMRFKSRIVVEGPDGREVGRFLQEKALTDTRFVLEAGGSPCGTMAQATHRDDYDAHPIYDVAGDEVASVTWTMEGQNLKAAVTTADSYTLEVHRPLVEPLRTLVYAAPLALDLAENQRTDW